jgi:transposase
MKQRSLQLIDEGWEMEDVANVLGVASKSIRRWTDNYDMHRRADPPSVLRGRPCILNSEAISDLHELICGTLTLFLDEIGEWLALYHDQPISTSVPKSGSVRFFDPQKGQLATATGHNRHPT